MNICKIITWFSTEVNTKLCPYIKKTIQTHFRLDRLSSAILVRV
jgi:hypothetical protein